MTDPTSTGVLIDALPGPVGVEVRGLRPGDTLGSTGASAEVIDALRAALDRRHLLLLKGPVMSGERQTAFVARFGPLIAERGLWGYVSNVRDDGIVREGPLRFHADFAFTPTPVWVISLHALDVPPSGSTTVFANASAGVLPADLRRRLEGKSVINVYDFGGTDAEPMRDQRLNPRSPRAEHPVLAPHPRTGETVVMANELHAERIVGVTAAESDALLADLFDVLYDDGNTYAHDWAVGDLVVWDNIAVHHGRRDFPAAEPRTLQRVTLGLYTPSEAVPGLADLLAATRT
jgi:taurine dioxygenase